MGSKKVKYDGKDMRINNVVLKLRDWLKEHFKSGAECPVCRRLVHCYKRKLTVSIVRQLVKLYKKGGGWHNKDSWADTNISVYAHPRQWGLIEKKISDSEKKKSSGMWRITQKGIDFVEGRIAIPDAIFVYLNEVQGVSETRVKIAEVIENFDYSKIKPETPLHTLGM